MKSFVAASCVALFVMSLIPTSVRAEGIANPAYDSWAKCAIGSSATFVQTSESGGHKLQVDITKTLSEKADDHVTVDTTSVQSVDGKAGAPQADKETVPAKLDKQPTQKKLANEQIVVSGHKLDCTVNEMDITDAQGGNIQIKLWTCPDVPGGLVKMQAKSTTTNITLQLKSFEKK